MMQKYKTVIEIVCEAEDQNEALDVAGEYLRGTLSSGVVMRCQTRPIFKGSKFMITGFMALGLIGAGMVSTNFTQPQSYHPTDQIGFNACQAPLNTNVKGALDASFKDRWHDKGISSALRHIKK